MPKDLQTNPKSSSTIKSSWAKDYVIIVIGLMLVILSNYSSLNNNTNRKGLLKGESKISIDAPVITEKLSSFIKEGI